jgi:hypothetical protein
LALAPLRSAVFSKVQRLTTNFKPLMKHILGIDMAKDKFDCCLLAEGAAPSVGLFANTPAGFKKLMRWLAECGADAATLRACMEATGLYGEKLLRWLFDQGAAVSKVNPAQIKYFAMSRLARNKTDRVDARIIAEFCRTREPQAWRPPQPERARLQALNRLLRVRKEQLASERRRSAMVAECARAQARALLLGLRWRESADDTAWFSHPPSRAKWRFPDLVLSWLFAIGRLLIAFRHYAGGQLFVLGRKGVVTNCKAVTMLGTVCSLG